MALPQEPKPVKFFAALLAARRELLCAVESDLAGILGTVEARTDVFPWTISTYYEPEMGPGLLRHFIAFRPLLSPGSLAEIKLQAQAVEDKYRAADVQSARRQVNVDPGYIDAGKVVLASTKGAGHRIYLQSGIHAEITLLYYNGSFHPGPFTYADFLWPETQSFLRSLRSSYLKQLRQPGSRMEHGARPR